MAKAQYITLEGKAMWAKVFEENRDMEGFEGSAKAYGGQYVIDLIMEPEEVSKLEEAGSRLKPKVTDDGVVVRFKRKHIGPFDDASGAPTVVKADGSPWDFGNDGPIGNGSTVRVRVCIYPSKFGKGTRLEAVAVKELVEFEERKSSFIEELVADEVPF